MEKEKEVIVKCSFCSKEIPCLEDEVNFERHSCIDCFISLKDELDNEELGKVHVAIPKDRIDEVMSDIFIDFLMTNIFPKLWQDKKSELKEMSKKEIAEAMFAAGAEIAIDSLELLDKQTEDDEYEDEEDEDENEEDDKQIG